MVLMNTASEYVPVFNGRKYFVVVPLFFNVIAWLVKILKSEIEYCKLKCRNISARHFKQRYSSKLSLARKVGRKGSGKEGKRRRKGRGKEGKRRRKGRGKEGKREGREGREEGRKGRKESGKEGKREGRKVGRKGRGKGEEEEEG